MDKSSIKTIASALGISHTVVAAVLGNKKGSARYSEQTRIRVLKEAERQHYTPDRLASAMVTGKVPLVALLLHTPIDIALNLYLHDSLLATARRLETYGHEMIYVPYADEHALMAKLDRLINGGLVGGIIFNGTPAKLGPAVERIMKSDVPFVYLGPKFRDDIISIDIDTALLYERIRDIARERGQEHIVIVNLSHTDPQALSYRDIDGAVMERKDILAEDTLFVCMGAIITRMFQQLGAAPHVLTVEDTRLTGFPCPALLVQPIGHERNHTAVDLVERWMDGKRPDVGHTAIPLVPEHLSYKGQ